MGVAGGLSMDSHPLSEIQLNINKMSSLTYEMGKIEPVKINLGQSSLVEIVTKRFSHNSGEPRGDGQLP